MSGLVLWKGSTALQTYTLRADMVDHIGSIQLVKALDKPLPVLPKSLLYIQEMSCVASHSQSM